MWRNMINTFEIGGISRDDTGSSFQRNRGSAGQATIIPGRDNGKQCLKPHISQNMWWETVRFSAHIRLSGVDGVDGLTDGNSDMSDG